MRTHISLVRRKCFLGAALVLASMFAPTAQAADESYYLIVFAAQRAPTTPRYSHTFATVVKATENGTDRSKYKVEEHPISWIAKSKEIVLARAKSEPGVNLSLRGSLRLAASLDETISMWGPFEIKKELYDRALKQIEVLESGKLQYKALDVRFRPETAINCIHAVSDLDTDQGLLDTGAACGDEASRMVANHLRRWMVKPETTHTWLIKRLGLEDYAITRHSWDD
jgi:hypothetical protein